MVDCMCVLRLGEQVMHDVGLGLGLDSGVLVCARVRTMPAPDAQLKGAPASWFRLPGLHTVPPPLPYPPPPRGDSHAQHPAPRR